ncbi:unnamed protein product [Mytilus coruscus]|uniref:Uncharacterized protein n=1 Tax=Mytilus coruscus TaxID=42192 RepID=A0A6J8DTW7_MYTCO|nr:unnamed protein product [Mytilus coruscus]
MKVDPDEGQKESQPETEKEILKYIKRDGFTLQPNGENKKLEKAINHALNEHMFGDEIYLVFESKFSDLEKEKIRQIAQNHHVTVDDQVINNQVFVVIEKVTENYVSGKRQNLGISGKYFLKPPRTKKLSTSILPQGQTSMVFQHQPAVPKTSTSFFWDDHCNKDGKNEHDLSEKFLKRPIPITDDINQRVGPCTKTMRPPKTTIVSGGTFVPFNSNQISQNTLSRSVAACTTKTEFLPFCSTNSEFSPMAACPTKSQISPLAACPTKSQISPMAACPTKSEFPPYVYFPVPFQYLQCPEQFKIQQQATHFNQHEESIRKQCSHYQQRTLCTYHQHGTQSVDKKEETQCLNHLKETEYLNNQVGTQYLNQQEETPYINFEERILHLNDQLETKCSSYQREAHVNQDKPNVTHSLDDQNGAPHHSRHRSDQDQYSVPLYSYLKLMS